MDEQNSISESTAEAAAAEETGAKAADAGQSTDSGNTPRLTWQEIMADPEYKKEYDRQVQDVVRRRLRGREDAESRLGRLAPVLEAVSGRYFGTDDSWDSIDMEELAATVSRGLSGRELEERRQSAMDRLSELLAQSGRLRQEYPGFDLDREMSDPRFVRLTAPGSGLSLADAYFALHREELTAQTAKRSLEAASRSVSTGARRPRENSGRCAGTAPGRDPMTMTKDERSALRRRIREAAANGQRIRYGE